jgi:hypothetical protein
MGKKKTCKIIKTWVYYWYEYKEWEVHEVKSRYYKNYVFVKKYDPFDDERYNLMIDWDKIEIDF